MTASTPNTRPRRSVLYMPASNERAIEKARTLKADAVVFDLEDAVAPAAKPQARANLVAAFETGGFGERETVIRTNTIGSAAYELDLQTIAQCQPNAVLLPKVSSVAEVETFLADAGKARFPAALQAWYMIETVPALVELKSHCCHRMLWCMPADLPGGWHQRHCQGHWRFNRG